MLDHLLCNFEAVSVVQVINGGSFLKILLVYYVLLMWELFEFFIEEYEANMLYVWGCRGSIEY